MIKILYIRSCTKCCYCSLSGDRCLHSEGDDRWVLGNDIPEWCPLPSPQEEAPILNTLPAKEFREWWKTNAVDLNESYSKADMEWIAEKAWNATKQDVPKPADATNDSLSMDACPMGGHHEDVKAENSGGVVCSRCRRWVADAPEPLDSKKISAEIQATLNRRVM